MPLKKYLDYDGLDYLIQRIPRTKIRVTFDDVFAGETATCSMGTTTYTKTVPATEPYELVFPINELGTWTIATSYLGDDYGTTIEVTAIGQTATGHVSHVTEIDGATVTPTDDVTTWLKCANIEDASITTLADVLANRSLFETLIANSNACKYMARSTTWALAEGAVPTMTSNTTPSGECFGSTQHDANSTYFKAFDGDATTSWFCHDTEYGTTDQAYVGYDFGEAVILNRATYSVYAGTSIEEKIIASNNKSTWTVVSDTKTTATGTFDINTNGVSYRYYAIRGSMAFNNTRVNQVYDLQFYGADITRSQSAMSLIGKYDYCSNALLGNATWCEAIANSDYFEEVLNVKVPVMTGDTAPSGNAICSSYANTYNAYRAFDGNTSTDWRSYTNNVQQYVGYKFTKNVKIYKVYARVGGLTQQTATGKIRFGYTNSSNQNVYLTDIEAQTNYQNGKSIAVSMTEEADNFKLFSENNGSGNYANLCVYDLQFYGRASSEVYVPLVPTMTSDSTPSGTGTVIYSSQYTDQKGFYAFDGVTSDSWSTNGTEFPCYIGYHFNTAKVVSRCSVLQRINGTFNGVTETAKVQASNDGETWTDLTDSQTFVIMVSSNASWINIDFSNSTAYTYYRLYITAVSNANVWGTCAELQFYEKAAQTNIIHSVPNDTIYMMENGSPVVLTTTNSDGDGILDFTQFMDGTYTLYSSVAKDIETFTNDFSKSIRITKTSFGCTTEAYLLPDVKGLLYWYGIESDNLQDMTSANGWTIPGGYSLYTPVHGTNSIVATAANGVYSGVGTKNIVTGTTVYSYTTGGTAWLAADSSKTTSLGYRSLGSGKLSYEFNGSKYLCVSVSGQTPMYIYALWYD